MGDFQGCSVLTVYIPCPLNEASYQNTGYPYAKNGPAQLIVNRHVISETNFPPVLIKHNDPQIACTVSKVNIGSVFQGLWFSCECNKVQRSLMKAKARDNDL